MNTKSFARVEVKDASLGTVTAVFSTYNVKDHDGDVTLPGAIPDGAPVVISAYGHKSWEGALPVGKGVIRDTGDTAILEGEFFLNTTHGRDTFETVKALGDQQEWSYSLRNVTAEMGMFEGETVRFLKSMDVKEVSPTLLGAGIGTRTLAVKSYDGVKFSEHIEAVVADVDALITRASEVVALRAEKGKGISAESVDLLAVLDGSLKRLAEVLAPEVQSTDHVDEATAEFLRFVASKHGVTTTDV